VAKVWNLHADVELNTRVTEARYQTELNRWALKTAESDTTWRCRWLIAATGTSFKQHIPDWPGRQQFKGAIHHSALWPEHVELKDKRVAVIGAGSTGVQIVQEASKVSSQTTQFIRTPNYAIPMRQRQITEDEIYSYLPQMRHVFKACQNTHSGLPVEGTGIKVFDESSEQRRARLEHGWKQGGFNW
jgi:cation diffusion facilitator CzcD-associated flavoprotein CzcO